MERLRKVKLFTSSLLGLSLVTIVRTFMEPDHLNPADVFGFVEDDLDPAWLELLWEHLDGCGECVHYLAEVLGADRPATD